jgi:hypothetical protein
MDTPEILIATHGILSLVILQTWGLYTEAYGQRPGWSGTLFAVLCALTPIVNVFWIFMYLYSLFTEGND